MSQESQDKKKKFSVNFILDGSFLNTHFLRQQYKFLLLLVLMLIIYIGNRYTLTRKIAEVDALGKELTKLRYEVLVHRSHLMQESRQSHIYHLVEEKGLELKSTSQAPYRLKVKRK